VTAVGKYRKAVLGGKEAGGTGFRGNAAGSSQSVETDTGGGAARNDQERKATTLPEFRDHSGLFLQTNRISIVTVQRLNV